MFIRLFVFLSAIAACGSAYAWGADYEYEIRGQRETLLPSLAAEPWLRVEAQRLERTHLSASALMQEQGTRQDFTGFGDSALSNTEIRIDGHRVWLSDAELSTLDLSDYEAVELFDGQGQGPVLSLSTKRRGSAYSLNAGSEHALGLGLRAFSEKGNGAKLSYRKSDGSRDNAFERNFDFLLSANPFEALGSDFTAQYVDDSRGLPGPQNAPTPLNRADSRALYLRADLEPVQAFSLKSSYGRKNQDLFFAPATDTRTFQQAVSLEPRMKLGAGLSALSAFRFMEFQSAGTRVMASQGVVLGLGLEPMAASVWRAELRWDQDWRKYGPNAMTWTSDGAWSALLGASKELASVLWRASLARGFRRPQFDERCSLLSGQCDSGLRIQNSLSLNLGAERMPSWQLLLTLSQQSQELFYNPVTFVNSNLDADTQRLKLYGLYRPLLWTGKGGLELRGHSAGTFWLSRISSGQFAGRHIPSVPDYQLTQGLRLSELQFGDGLLSCELMWLATGTSYAGSDYENTHSQVPSYTLWNAELNWDAAHANSRQSKWGLSFRVSNVLDRQYPQMLIAGSSGDSIYPAPGREWWLGVRGQL